MPYGVIINCIAVFIGGLLGAVLKDYFPDKLKAVSYTHLDVYKRQSRKSAGLRS